MKDNMFIKWSEGRGVSHHTAGEEVGKQKIKGREAGRKRIGVGRRLKTRKSELLSCPQVAPAFQCSMHEAKLLKIFDIIPNEC